MKHFLLNGNWQFRKHTTGQPVEPELAEASGWLPASVPGTVHQDLLAAGQIPDPFYGLNEQAVQWVGESDWLYRCDFDLPAGFERQAATRLCFEGLDTFATVWLNGQTILTSDNMFVPRRVEVGELLRPTGNSLVILFESAVRRGDELETKHGKQTSWNGSTSRLQVRKAQYHYGWDWGPTLITAGLWKEVRLETFAARLTNLSGPTEVSADLQAATITARAEIETAMPGEMSVTFRLFDPAGELVAEQTAPAQDGLVQAVFTVAKPALWWPHGYGAQPLYRLEAVLHNPQGELDRSEKRLGLRRLRLVQEPLENAPGTSFMFEINNTPVFCSGANWIPADSFTPRISPERYRSQLQIAAEANMVMLRIWGGGIYENDLFYDTCDELGLLVWQDFMFACGIYPAHAEFQASVRSEVEVTVRRLRDHPSLAIWAGNNEDYSIACSLGVYDKTFEGDFSQTKFPARAIYEQLLPDLCARLDPTRPYWPGSPYGGADVNDQTVGDRHTWDIWHGAMADYHDYPKYAGRFVSEFGMASLPGLKMIEEFAPPAERQPYSRTLDWHNKASDGPRRIAAYLNDNLPLVSGLESYVYASQFIQAEAMAFALRGWRRRWGGPGRYEVAGALVWQLNDCWPVTSWAIVDYDLTPKPAYYALRQEMAPLTIGLWDERNGQASLWGVSSLTTPVEAELHLTTYDLQGQLLAEEWRSVTLLPNQATEWAGLPYQAAEELVVGATLQQNGEVLARATLWPEPFKYLALPDPEIEIVRLPGDRLQLTAQRPAKGVFLSATQPVAWSDNLLDLLPNQPQVITAPGLGTAEVKIQTLHDLFPKPAVVYAQ